MISAKITWHRYLPRLPAKISQLSDRKPTMNADGGEDMLLLMIHLLLKMGLSAPCRVDELSCCDVCLHVCIHVKYWVYVVYKAGENVEKRHNYKNSAVKGAIHGCFFFKNFLLSPIMKINWHRHRCDKLTVACTKLRLYLPFICKSDPQFLDWYGIYTNNGDFSLNIIHLCCHNNSPEQIAKHRIITACTFSMRNNSKIYTYKNRVYILRSNGSFPVHFRMSTMLNKAICPHYRVSF